MVSKPKKSRRVGVTISQSELGTADVRLPLEPPPAENGHWPSLASALAELADHLGVKQGEGALAISLASPFTEVRRIELPPVREDDLQRLLARGAARYFVNARGPQVVGASQAGPRTKGAPVPMIAAAAPARLIAMIKHAAQQAGWSIDHTVPAESAWTSAALAIWPTFAKQRAFVLVTHEDRTELLALDDGRLAGVRRFRAGAADAVLIAEAIGAGAHIGTFGSVVPRKQLTNALASRGLTIALPTGEWADIGYYAEAIAARFAGDPIGPVLRSEDTLIAERSRAQRVAWQLAGVAVMLFLAGAAIELWGVHRQLERVRAERAAIRPQIASTMVGRTTVEAAYRHLSSLATVERNAPHWSSVIGRVSDALPDDAFLLSLRTRDDSLIIDGLADHASPVFNALEKSNALTDVRAAAPVRRELQDGGTVALEHFTIAARVVPPSAVEKSK